MAKFHITPSGQARNCSAQPGNCRYGENGVDPEHYNTKKEAQQAYEKQQETKQTSMKSVKKAKLDEGISKDEKLRRIDEYQLQMKKYNSLLEEGGEKPSLGTLIDLRETAETMSSAIEPIRNFNPQIQDIYIATLEEQHETLQNEKIALQKEYKKSGKASLGSLFSANKKAEQEAKTATLEQAIAINAESVESLESKYNNYKNKVQQRRLQELSDRGYSIIDNYKGMNMSLHPQGPKISFICPSCYQTNQTRVYKNTSIKNTGYLVNCASCPDQSILPVTKINIKTLEE